MFYAALAPLGNLARFGSTETELGVTTVLLTIMLGINAMPAVRTAVKSRSLLSLLVLAAWMAVTGLLADNAFEAYSQLAGFLVYIAFAAVAFRVGGSLGVVRAILVSLIFGGLLSSSLTLVDWFKVVDIPGVNELSASTNTELGYVLQASGPFVRRSAMAAYFAVLIPVGVLGAVHLTSSSKRTRVVFALTAASCAIALLLTHNRAGLLGGIASIVAVSIYTARSPMRLIRVILLGIATILVSAWIVATYLPDQFNVYRALFKVGGVASGDPFLPESDRLRLVFINHVLSSLPANPIGHGYTMLSGVSGFDRIDPHNILAQIIWAAGVFGLLWICIFGAIVIHEVRAVFANPRSLNSTSQVGVVIAGGLIGWFLCGMAHNIIATGISWLLFGLLLRLSARLRGRNGLRLALAD